MGSGKKSKSIQTNGVVPAGTAVAFKKVIVSKLPNGQVRVEVVDQ